MAVLPDPELAEQDAPLRVVLIVAYPRRDEGDVRAVERGDDRSAGKDGILDPPPEPDGLRRVVNLRRRGTLHLRVDRAVAEPGQVHRSLRRARDVGGAAQKGPDEALGGREVQSPTAEADLRSCSGVGDSREVLRRLVASVEARAVPQGLEQRDDVPSDLRGCRGRRPDGDASALRAGGPHELARAIQRSDASSAVGTRTVTREVT